MFLLKITFTYIEHELDFDENEINFIAFNKYVNKVDLILIKIYLINIEDYDGKNTTLVFSLPGFNTKSVNINNQNFEIISFPASAANLEHGYPDLPSISKSILIPNESLMKVENYRS